MKVLPAAYLAGLASLLLARPWRLAALAALATGFLLVLTQFALYRRAGEGLFPAAACANVEGVVEPEGEALRELVISGHHDSAPLSRFFGKPWQCLYPLAVFLPYPFLFLEAVLLAGRGAPPPWALPVLVAGLPALAAYFLAVSTSRGSPGAGDNLVSSVLAGLVARELAARRGEALRHTRLRVLSFDAEEVGLRGAAAYFEALSREAPLPRYHLNFDSLFALDRLALLTRDLNGLRTVDGTMLAALRTVARGEGIALGEAAIPFGGGATDAVESARRGIASASVIAQPLDILREPFAYHSDEDRPEGIEPAVLDACARLAFGLVERLEAGRGLPG